ncbi:MAG: RtcB family protein [Chloroflexi bacterium]|nr:RtcB family protein [Chloroflexota bacterium]
MLEENTRLQAEMLSRSPVVFKHVALMPDAHLGIGATVGSVIATKGAVIPAAVGVDIGCGMIAVETNIDGHPGYGEMQILHDKVANVIRAGVGARGSWDEPRNAADVWMGKHPPSDRVKGELLTRAASQLGTLGSGNHFVEVCLDESDTVWVVIHSGSRGVGNRLATGHIKIAKDLCLDKGLEHPDLSYFTEGTQQFDGYIEDVLWAQGYALANREVMMDAVLLELFAQFGGNEVSRINCHHNFTQKETHYDEEVWLTRKGAIYAGVGAPGVIPGSMGTKSYITEGLGDVSSYLSSSHGAGRQRSRGAAKRELSMDGEQGLLSYMEGTAWNADGAKALMDEHPLAYKDLDQVMEDQKDLTKPVHTLRAILNYKGT